MERSIVQEMLVWLCQVSEDFCNLSHLKANINFPAFINHPSPWNSIPYPLSSPLTTYIIPPIRHATIHPPFLNTLNSNHNLPLVTNSPASFNLPNPPNLNIYLDIEAAFSIAHHQLPIMCIFTCVYLEVFFFCIRNICARTCTCMDRYFLHTYTE